MSATVGNPALAEDRAPAGALRLDARAWADGLLAEALQLDEDRPADDISVLVITVVPHSGDTARRLAMRVPLA